MIVTTPQTPHVDVTITSDLMCPWCWVGLKKLTTASKASNIDVNIRWRPFMLRPEIPLEGMPKDGTPKSRVGSYLSKAGNSVGIDFTGLTDRTPNTLLFHATIKFLQDDLSLDAETVTAYHEAVFEGYFTLGIYPDKEGILMAAKKVSVFSVDKTAAAPAATAASSGIDVHDHLLELFRNDEKLSTLQNEVREEVRVSSKTGISGVPTFAFNGRTVFSGAQSVETFARYLEKHSSSGGYN